VGLGSAALMPPCPFVLPIWWKDCGPRECTDVGDARGRTGNLLPKVDDDEDVLVLFAAANTSERASSSRCNPSCSLRSILSVGSACEKDKPPKLVEEVDIFTAGNGYIS